jgi:hypothetical protein
MGSRDWYIVGLIGAGFLNLGVAVVGYPWSIIPAAGCFLMAAGLSIDRWDAKPKEKHEQR